MADRQREWVRARDELVSIVRKLGFPEELGTLMAKQLGSPGAMRRMKGYLLNARPDSMELVVDEMLAICSDIERWKDKKAAEEANAKYNEILHCGLGTAEE